MSFDNESDSPAIPSASQTYAATVAKLKKTAVYQKVLRLIGDAVENQLTEIHLDNIRLPALLIIHLRRLGYSVKHDDITVISWLDAN